MTTTAPQAAGVVERPALFDLLDRGVQGPVTLVCAPAGSGKTMLVRSWARSRRPRPAIAATIAIVGALIAAVFLPARARKQSAAAVAAAEPAAA